MNSKLLVAALAVAGCTPSSGASSSSSAGSAAPGSSSEKAALDPDDALGAKLQAYIECSNQFVNDVHQARRNYLSEVNAKTGPTGKEERKIYLAPQLPDPKKCLDGLAAAAKAEPHIAELEKAGADLGAALTELVPPSAEGYKYYDHEDNRDDKGAKGRELHVKLVAAWADFDKAVAELDPVLEAQSDKLDASRLAKLEKQPEHRFRFLHARLMLDAKKVVSIAASVEDPKALPLDGFHTATAALTADTDEFTKYIADHKKEADDMWMTTFPSDADSLVKSAKSLERRKRDKVAYSDGEAMTINANNSAAVDGSPGQVIDRYNRLISDSNSLRWK